MNTPGSRLFTIFLALTLLASACAPRAHSPAAPTTVIVPPAASASPGQPPLPYRIETRQEGIYRLTPQELQTIGFGETPPENLHLSNGGQTWPFAYTQDGLFFYAPALETRYTDRNVFILRGETAPRKPLAPQPLPAAPAGAAPVRCRTRLHLEENRIYEPKVSAGDHWLWQKMVAPATWEETFALDGVQPGGGALTVTLWANTGRPAPLAEDFDHHWRISLNGQVIAEEAWSGSGRHDITGGLPEGLLHSGENTLAIEILADSGLAADIATLDAVDLTYPRAPQAEDGLLTCQSEEEGGLPAAGLEGNLYLWDLTDPEEPRLFEGQAGAGRAFEAAAAHRYVLHTPEGALPPLSLQPLLLSPDLLSPDNTADYLLIGAPPLLEALRSLTEHRAAQGLKPLAIPIQAVYDQFSEGLTDPEAIRSLLQYAARHWQTSPAYLLLVGDYTYDTLGYRTRLEYPLPGFMVYTRFGGETVSDVRFAQLDEDALPDLAVGRLPARTPEQARAYAQKALAFEAQSGGAWRKRVLAVADGQEAYFASDAQAFLEAFGPPFSTELYAPPADAPEVSQEVASRLEEGAWLVAYFGHGSLDQWGKDRLFTAAEAAALHNAGRLPIMLNMTCLTGLFTHPKVESLTETLLFAPQGGAAAVLAPTSLTLASDQNLLSQAFAAALLDSASLRLGDAFLTAQRQVPPENSGGRDVLLTFLLFGDPALQAGEGH